MKTIGSLFTGYGGLDLAIADVIGESRVAWCSDIKPAAEVLLENRYAGIPNLGDISDIDFAGAQSSPELRVDVLSAGWPCQPHSAAGKRLGDADPRALWPHVVRALAAIRPAVFFGENVARITSNGELRRVIRSFASLRYLGAWWCVRASDIGAAHKRDRCFIVAVDTLADPLSYRLWDQPRRAHGPDGAYSGIAGHDGAQRDAQLALLPTPTANHGDARRGTPSAEVGARRIAQGRRMLEDVVAAHLLPTPAVADSRTTRNATAGRTPANDRHHSGWTLSDVAHAQRWGSYAAAIQRWETVIGRPAPEPTQLSARTGKPQLAPLFVEWLMGVPQGWVTDVPGLAASPAGIRNAALSLLGDGVVPAQASAAFSELLRVVSDAASPAENA